MKENIGTKPEQKHRDQGRTQEEFEEINTEHRRVIGEERKKIKIETNKKTEIQIYKKQTLSRLSTIRSELKLETKKLEPRVTPPLKITLTNNQKTLLYILYYIFNGKNIKEALVIISKALSIDVGNLLHELMTLENLNLIVVVNGVVKFTSKGEIVVGTITINRNVINKVRELIAKVPKSPSVHISNVVVKTLDKKEYVAHMKTPKKELIVPTIPRIPIRDIIPLRIDKNFTITFNYITRKIAIPHIPQIISPKISMTLDKTMFITLTKNPKDIEKSVTKFTKKVEKTIETKSVRLPSSLLTMLFKSIKKYSVKGILEVKPDRPVIIIAIKSSNDDYIATLLSILREIYRIKTGGLPIGRYTGTKVTRYIAEDELIRQGFIKIIDDSKADFLEFFEITKVEEFDKINTDKLRDRLIELTLHGLCFLVFYIDKNKANSLLAYLISLRDKIAPAKIVVISPRKLNDNQKREIARIAWGFVDPKDPLINNTLDQHFKLREEEFYDILEKIASKRKYAKIVRESVEDEEGLEKTESALHYQLKVFIVYYLMKKLKIPKRDIETEIELSVNSKKIIPDIYVNSRKLAIEIETFYGTGSAIWRKLGRTIEKYKTTNVANEVWIVIPPFQTMLYIKELVSEIKELKEEGYRFIKLYTIDLSKKKLVPIEKIPRKLARLFTKLTKT